MNTFKDKNDTLRQINTESKNTLIAGKQAHVEEMYELCRSLVKAKNIICQLNKIHNNKKLANLSQSHEMKQQQNKTLIEGLNQELQKQNNKILILEDNVKQRQSLIENQKMQIQKFEQEEVILKQQLQEQLNKLQEELQQNRKIIIDKDETIQLKTKLIEELNNQVKQFKVEKDNTNKLSQSKIDELNQQLSQQQEHFQLQLKVNNQQHHEKLDYMKKQHDDEKISMGLTIQEQIIKINQLSQNELSYLKKNEQLICELNLFQQFLPIDVSNYRISLK